MLKHSSIFNLLSPQPTGHPSALDSSKISNFLFAAAHIWNHNALGSAQASRRVTDLNVGPNPTLPRGWGFLPQSKPPNSRFDAVPRSMSAVVGYGGPLLSFRRDSDPGLMPPWSGTDICPTARH